MLKVSARVLKGKTIGDLFIDYGIYSSVIILFLIFGALFPKAFLSIYNIRNILVSASVVGTMAVGMTFLILTTSIDLSVGSVAYFAVAVGVLGLKEFGISPFTGILLMIALSTAVGALNGLQVAKLKMVPLIATLAAMDIFRGLGLEITDAASIYGMPDAVSFIGIGSVGPIPMPVIVLFASYLVGYFILEKTRFGMFVFAVGNDPEAAYKAGIDVSFIRFMVYLIHGIFVGIASVILCARLDGVVPAMGVGMEFDVITAVILGGTSFSGGFGNIWGSLVGAVLIVMINTALNILNVSAFYYDIFKGSVIILAVILDTFRQRRIGIG